MLWRIATVHLEGKGVVESTTKEGNRITLDPLAGAIDLVLGYRNRHKLDKLAQRTGPRLRIVDERSAYFRLKPEEIESLALIPCIKHLLRLLERQA